MSAKKQVTRMWEYIRRHYGGTGHLAAHGWYDKGGILPPGVKLAWNDTDRPEGVDGAAD